ncbi:MAG: hypothetical protein KAG94_04470 [Clostridiales bacterium]|nr:hypothetical protein [Clostridiales bacterium]
MSENNQEVSVGNWIITMIVLSIPLVGFIMLFVWGFGDGTPKSKSNFCKASLLLAVIAIGISIVLAITSAAFLGDFINNFNIN